MMSAMQVRHAMIRRTMVGVRSGFVGHAPWMFFVLLYLARVRAMTAMMTMEKMAVRDCWMIT